uniref:DUF2179 domain-containing protein n=1 Tax=Schistosoma curassoni TaxID=6186 RepID=A0A183JP44_9TREM
LSIYISVNIPERKLQFVHDFYRLVNVHEYVFVHIENGHITVIRMKDFLGQTEQK